MVAAELKEDMAFRWADTTACWSSFSTLLPCSTMWTATQHPSWRAMPCPVCMPWSPVLPKGFFRNCKGLGCHCSSPCLGPVSCCDTSCRILAALLVPPVVPPVQETTLCTKLECSTADHTSTRAACLNNWSNFCYFYLRIDGSWRSSGLALNPCTVKDHLNAKMFNKRQVQQSLLQRLFTHPLDS